MIVLSEDTRKKLTDKLESLNPLVKGFIDIDSNNKFSNVASSIWFAHETLKSAINYSSTNIEIYQMQAVANNLKKDIDDCIKKTKNDIASDTPAIITNNISKISEIYLEYKNILDKGIEQSEKAAKSIIVNSKLTNFLPHLRNLTDLAEHLAYGERLEFIRGKLIDIKVYSSEAEGSLVNKINGIKVYDRTYWKFNDLIKAINELKTLSEDSSKVVPFVNTDVDLDNLSTKINRYYVCFEKRLKEGNISLSTIEQLKK